LTAGRASSATPPSEHLLQGLEADQLALAVEVGGDHHLVGVLGDLADRLDDVLVRGLLDDRGVDEVVEVGFLPVRVALREGRAHHVTLEADGHVLARGVGPRVERHLVGSVGLRRAAAQDVGDLLRRVVLLRDDQAHKRGEGSRGSKRLPRVSEEEPGPGAATGYRGSSVSAPSNPEDVKSGARKQHALQLFAGLPRRYDAAGAALSFGQDPRWRRAMVAQVGAGRQDRVLDVATGTGMVAAALVRLYGCEVVGLDQSPEMLAQAAQRLRADSELAARIELLEGQAESLPFADGEFDHLTFTYLLRYVDDPAATLRELARVVKPGGRIASLEFMLPPNALARALWHVYVRLGLPALGRLISRDWYDVGRFLGPSITGLYRRLPVERQLALWRDAGIESVEARVMSFGGGIVIWGTRGAAGH
jgi:demethylmenaquinone methyltransferase / 2-methoxy-6-polyprenyl-1,4-benzoquinol methylase